MLNNRISILCDIDGCILKSHWRNEKSGSMVLQLQEPPELLPGVIDKFTEWNAKGYCIVLVTGRPPSTRKETEKQLKKFGLFWDDLIFISGAGGARVLINDLKPNGENATAAAINLVRNEGLEKVDLELALKNALSDKK